MSTMSFRDCLFNRTSYRFVAFIEKVRQRCGVAIEAEDQLSEVVRSNGEAIEDVEKFVGEKDVGWQFTHHVDLQSILALPQAVFSHFINDFASFFHCSAKGNHDLYVAEAHRLTHAQ